MCVLVGVCMLVCARQREMCVFDLNKCVRENLCL